MPDTVEPTDDILVIIQPWAAATPPTASRTGWTTLKNDSVFGDRTLQFLVKDSVTGSEDGTTETFTIDQASLGTAISVAISGADDPANWAFATLASGTGSANPDPPSNTSGLGAVDTLWLAVAAAFDDDATFSSYPTNYSHYTDSVISGGGTNNGNELGIGARQLNAASENPGTFTISETENWCAQTVAIGPSPGITVTPDRAEIDLFAASPAAVLSIQPDRAELSLTARSPGVVSVEPAAALAFADGGHTNPRIEVALGHTDESGPTDWQWTDLSDRLRSRLGDLTIGIDRGRADEASDTKPSKLTTLLDNTDGYLTPGLTSSPWWPDVDIGLPLRCWEDGSTPALVLPGLPGAYAFTPDHADFDVTDIDVRIHLEPEAWSTGVVYTDGSITVDSRRWLVSRWTEDGDDRSWIAYLFDAGWPALRFSADGAAVSASSGSPTLVAALRPIWLAYTVDADDGGGNRVATWWRYDGSTPPDDVTTWTQVVQATDAGTMSLHATTAPLAIGAINEGADAPFAGRVLAMEHRDAINGTVIANPDFTALTPGTTSFTDAAGKPWQIAGMAHVSRRRLRFCGEVAEILPSWPYGDNQPDADLDDPRPSESRVRITANGVLRRLTRGTDPLRSTLTRKVIAVSGNVLAYWPGEDGRQAAHLAAGIPDVDAMDTTGLSMANDDSLPASDALPTIPAGDAATWSAAVPAPDAFDDQWAVEMVLYIETPETNPTTTQILSITTEGTIARWTVEISDTTLTVTTYDSGSTQIDQNSSGISSSDFGTWIIFRLEAAQDGADVDWTWTISRIDTGGGGGVSDTITSETIGRVTGVDTSATGPPDGMSFGHIIVHDGNLVVGWLAGADTAWVGESAAHRFWRLCTEEGIPVEVIGDPGVAADFRGDLSISQAMGPQQRKTLVDLLRDCVQIDLGILIEHKGIPGLIYRCRTDIDDQDVQLALDASNNEIEDLAPTRDNAELINEIKVTSTSGSSAVAVDTTSRDRHGPYADSVEINGVGGLDVQAAIIADQAGLADAIDEQNAQQASWRLALGTVDGMRYPELTIDLGTATDLIETWLTTVLGDRVTLTGLPAQHPAETVELILQHVTERETPTSWILRLTFSPGDVWLTGELVE